MTKSVNSRKLQITMKVVMGEGRGSNVKK